MQLQDEFISNTDASMCMPKVCKVSTIGYGLAISFALALLANAPILPRMNSSFLGFATLGDQVVFAWNLWWTHKALHDPNISLWFCDHIYHPDGVSLANHTLMPLHSIWLSAIMPKVGLVMCTNLLTLLSCWLTCIAIFLFALELGIAPLAATASMIVFGLSSFRVVELSGGHINVAMLEGIVFQAYFLVRLLKFGGYANATAFSLSVLYTGWTEKMGLLFAAMLDAAILVIHWAHFKSSLRSAFKPTAIALTIIAVGISPIIWLTVSNPMPFPKEPSLLRDATWFFRWLSGRATFEQARAAVQGSWGSAGAESADLVNFVGIEARNPFLQNVEHSVGEPRMPSRVFPGYIALCILVTSLTSIPSLRKRSKGWLIAFVCFAILCLGPLLRVGGKLLPIPLPYAILHYIPLLNHMRAPYRFASLTSLCIAVAVGMALSEMHSRPCWASSTGVRRAWISNGICVGVCLLLLVESLAWWWRMHPLNIDVPPALKQIASEKGDFAILEIPLGRWGGIASIGVVPSESVFYQCFHGKRILGGAVSRAPTFKVTALLKEPLFATLIALQDGQTDLYSTMFSHKAALQVMSRLRIRYVVIHKGWFNSPPHIALLRSLPLKLRYRDRNVIVYEIRP